MILITYNENKNILVNKYISIAILIKIIKYDENIIFAYINDKLVNINYKLMFNANIKFIKPTEDIHWHIIKHSCAHLLAHAVKILFPSTNIAMGLVTKNGFYYDFDFKQHISYLDLKIIEKKMLELSQHNLDIIESIISKEKAFDIFKNELYKLKIIDKIDNNEKINCYKQGNFIDLCLGPHVPNTNIIKYFKLLKISGAYWDGMCKNIMLQRIYGTVWESKDKLNKHLYYLETIKIKDHKKIGNHLNMFSFFNEAPGVVFWQEKGWNIYNNILIYIRSILNKNNYHEINTPSILNSQLFEKSGHIDKFGDNIFKYKDNNNNLSILKPMNCPCHIKIFNINIKSYKDLPLRFSEFGLCFRNEISGSLHGLMRLKQFTQDDGHIFCEEKHIYEEIITFINMTKEVYHKFGFKNFSVRISGKPDNLIDDIDLWHKSENILKKAVKYLNLEYEYTNDGAFYGPKIEILLNDNFERLWQCGTIQIDYFTAKKLNARYRNKDSKILYPIILHRAILGSIERFIGILIENNEGVLPFWITPIQFIIITISDNNIKYANYIYLILKKNYRIEIDIINEKFEYKLRKYIMQKIPYIIIIGDKEQKNNTITLRTYNGENIKNIILEDLKNFVDI